MGPNKPVPAFVFAFAFMFELAEDPPKRPPVFALPPNNPPEEAGAAGFAPKRPPPNAFPWVFAVFPPRVLFVGLVFAPEEPNNPPWLAVFEDPKRPVFAGFACDWPKSPPELAWPVVLLEEAPQKRPPELDWPVVLFDAPPKRPPELAWPVVLFEEAPKRPLEGAAACPRELFEALPKSPPAG